MPPMRRNSVDLPAPLAPISPTLTLRGDRQRYALQDPFSGAMLGLVTFVHILDNDHRITNWMANRRYSIKPSMMLTTPHANRYGMLRPGTVW